MSNDLDFRENSKLYTIILVESELLSERIKNLCKFFQKKKKFTRYL